MRTLIFSWIPLLLLWLLAAAPAGAQEEAPSFQESFFTLRPGEEDPMFEATDVCASAFAGPLVNSGSYMERGTQEMTQTVSGCVEEMGSPQFTRECELAIARTEVDLVFVFRVREMGESTWMFEVAAHRPMINAGVWRADEVSSGENLLLAARTACAGLGERFLVPQTGDTGSPDGDATDHGEPDVQEGGEESDADMEPPPLEREADRAPESELARGSLHITNGYRRTRDVMVSVVASGERFDCRFPVTEDLACDLEGVPYGQIAIQVTGTYTNWSMASFAPDPEGRPLRVEVGPGSWQRIGQPLAWASIPAFAGVIVGFVGGLSDSTYDATTGETSDSRPTGREILFYGVGLPSFVIITGAMYVATPMALIPSTRVRVRVGREDDNLERVPDHNGTWSAGGPIFQMPQLPTPRFGLVPSHGGIGVRLEF